jgi:hypothetical protein
MEARQGSQDLLALRQRRRQRPSGGRLVRAAKVFEQKVPVLMEKRKAVAEERVDL